MANPTYWLLDFAAIGLAGVLAVLMTAIIAIELRSLIGRGEP